MISAPFVVVWRFLSYSEAVPNGIVETNLNEIYGGALNYFSAPFVVLEKSRWF